MKFSTEDALLLLFEIFKTLLSIIFIFTYVYLQKLVSFDVNKSSMLTMKLEYPEIKLGVL